MYEDEELNESWNNALNHHDRPWELDEHGMRSLCADLSLDESYMREHKDILKWGLLCQYQKMSISFIREMDEQGYIKWFNLAMNEHNIIDEKLIEEHIEEMCRYNLVHWDVPIIELFINRKFSKEFFKRNYCYIDWDRVYGTISMKSGLIINQYKDWLIQLGIHDKYKRRLEHG